MDQLFTWEALSTLAGSAAITYLIVAYTKAPIDLIWPKVLGTDLYAVLVGGIVLLLATVAITGGLTWEAGVLALFNGFLVAATAGKINDKAVKEAGR